MTTVRGVASRTPEARPDRRVATAEAKGKETVRPGGQRAIDPAAEAWRLMRDLVLGNDRRAEASAELGLSFGRIRALRRVAEGPLSMGALAADLGTDGPYTTILVDALEAQGLVERVVHPDDRRAKLVVATGRGLGVARRATSILETPPADVSSLAPRDLDALLRILRRAARSGREPAAAPVTRQAARGGSTKE